MGKLELQEARLDDGKLPGISGQSTRWNTGTDTAALQAEIQASSSSSRWEGFSRLLEPLTAGFRRVGGGIKM